MVFMKQNALVNFTRVKTVRTKKQIWTRKPIRKDTKYIHIDTLWGVRWGDESDTNWTFAGIYSPNTVFQLSYVRSPLLEETYLTKSLYTRMHSTVTPNTTLHTHWCVCRGCNYYYLFILIAVFIQHVLITSEYHLYHLNK